MVKVAVLGGSGIATPELVDALVRRLDLKQPLELVLVGRSPGKLAKVASLCASLARPRPQLTISQSTDFESALADARYVINQIRVGGLQARAFDETFPHAFDLPGEETVGPGGFANALRTIPVVLGYARLIEEVAPEATLLTFANPSSLVQYAITRHTAVNTIGLCDSPVTMIRGIAGLLGAPVAELSVDYAGMHHFGWVTGLRWRGQDVLQQVLQRAHEILNLGIEAELVKALGAIPHFYLKYFFHRERMLTQQRGKPARARQLMALQEEILAAYDGEPTDKPAALSKRGARWYESVIVPVLVALVENRSERHIVNVQNGTTLPWLPPEAIIETPAVLEEGWGRPLPPHSVPDAVRALIQHNCAYEMLAVEAIVEQSYTKALRALVLNPMGITYDQAKGILKRIWPTGMPQESEGE